MARLKYFVHTVLSGYLFLGTNILYTLASVPLALRYLSTAEFGLWAMASQLTAFLGLVDAGLGNAVGRLLIDEKDHKESTAYGSLVQTAALVNAVQGLMVIGLAVVISFTAAPLLQLPFERYSAFRALVLGQGVVLGVQFMCRIFGNLLVAHQRNDAGNYLNSISLVFGFVVLWLSFAFGAGVMALVWSQLAGALLTLLLAWFGCYRLKLLPEPGKWGRVSWARFSEMFSFGQRILLLLLGTQLVQLSPTIIVTRLLGLEAAAVWSICTRPFLLVLQIVTRIFDAGAPAFAEMIVRGEDARLLSRFRSLATAVMSLSVVAACLLFLTNQPFVTVWTSGKIGWANTNDFLLGLWLLALTATHVHSGFAVQTKILGALPYVVCAQGVVFVGATVWLLSWTSLSGTAVLLTTAMIASCTFSLPYSLSLTSRYFKIPLGAILRTLVALPAKLLLYVAALAAVLWWATEPLVEPVQLVLRIIGMGLPAGILLIRVGIEESIRQDFVTRAPSALTRPLRLIVGLPR
jgi:O-antigen/teichoic acid export membrane protein